MRIIILKSIRIYFLKLLPKCQTRLTQVYLYLKQKNVQVKLITKKRSGEKVPKHQEYLNMISEVNLIIKPHLLMGKWITETYTRNVIVNMESLLILNSQRLCDPLKTTIKKHSLLNFKLRKITFVLFLHSLMLSERKRRLSHFLIKMRKKFQMWILLQLFKTCKLIKCLIK
jgi:hypothetical protein